MLIAAAKLSFVAMLSLAMSDGGTETSIRCGTHLVGLGATGAEVQEACGPPTRVETNSAVLTGRCRPLRFEQIVWTYDYGSTQFTRSLVFQDGALSAIHIGAYGN